MSGPPVTTQEPFRQHCPGSSTQTQGCGAGSLMPTPRVAVGRQGPEILEGLDWEPETQVLIVI